MPHSTLYYHQHSVTKVCIDLLQKLTATVTVGIVLWRAIQAAYLSASKLCSPPKPFLPSLSLQRNVFTSQDYIWVFQASTTKWHVRLYFNVWLGFLKRGQSPANTTGQTAELDGKLRLRAKGLRVTWLGLRWARCLLHYCQREARKYWKSWRWCSFWTSTITETHISVKPDI